MSDVLKAVLKTVYGYTDEQVAGTLAKTDAEQTSEILALDANRVTKFKTAQTEAFDNGHKKGKGETLSVREKELRTKYEIDDETLTGDSLIETIVSKKAGASGTGAKGKLTDDEIKAHPLYVALQEQAKKDVTAKEKEWQEKYDGYESKIQREGRLSKAKAEAEKLLTTLNPVLPKNADVAANLKNLFASQLEGYDYDFQDGVIVVTKDGKVVEDKHGKRVGFDEIVKDISSKFFEFAESTPRENAGNENKQGNEGAPGTGKKFATLAELNTYIDDSSVSVADKTAAMAAFKEANK